LSRQVKRRVISRMDNIARKTLKEREREWQTKLTNQRKEEPYLRIKKTKRKQIRSSPRERGKINTTTTTKHLVVVGNLIGIVFFLPSFLSEKAVSLFLSLSRFTCVVLFEWVGVDG